MTWTPLSLGAAPDVLATITKKRVVLALTGAAVRRLGWSEEEPNLSVALGEGEHAGWLRIELDEDGASPETANDCLCLTLPRSALPDLLECRLSPLTWRPADGAAIEVRLPTIAAVARSKPKLAVADGKRVAPEPEAAGVEIIGVPDLYAGLYKSAWENGVELAFLSDGTVLVNGKISSVDDVETTVRTAVERRNDARSRAS